MLRRSLVLLSSVSISRHVYEVAATYTRHRCAVRISRMHGRLVRLPRRGVHLLLHLLHLGAVGGLLLHGHGVLRVAYGPILRLRCPRLLGAEGPIKMPRVQTIRIITPLLDVLAPLGAIGLILGGYRAGPGNSILALLV